MEPKNEKLEAESGNKKSLFDEDKGSDEETADSEITPVELALLDGAGINESATDEDLILEEALLDDMDEDGDKLNEAIDLSGEDLDVPGSESDDDAENIGEEDEENNSYSLSRQKDEPDSDL
ncbi:MAG: hypothetical protein H7Z13_03305 [Ferruginibacter sp.]|nr:hypothetical protein [Ferruginibacter sp.]